MDDDLMRGITSAVMLVVILNALPLADKLIYWTGWVVGRLLLRAKQAMKRASRGGS